MHEVLVNRLGGLSLPRKSVVRLTDRPDMTLDVYRGRKTTNQQINILVEKMWEAFAVNGEFFPLKGWILCYTVDPPPPPNLIPSNRQVIRRSKISTNHLIIRVIKYCRAETTARFRGPNGVYSLT